MPEANNNVPEMTPPNPPVTDKAGNPYDEDDFLAGLPACDLTGEGTCEACQ